MLERHEYLGKVSVMCVVLHSTVGVRILELIVSFPSHVSSSFAICFYERKRITNEVLEKGERESNMKDSRLQANKLELRARDITVSECLVGLIVAFTIMDRKQVFNNYRVSIPYHYLKRK